MNETIPAPAADALANANPRVGQIDPSDGYAYYTCSKNGILLAEVVATKAGVDPPPETEMKAGREYWKIQGDEFKSMGCGDLAVTKVKSGTWDTAGQLPYTASDASFDVPVDALWRHANGNFQYHKSDDQAAGGAGLCVDISRMDGRWSGTMRFYCDNSSDLLFAKLNNGTEWTLKESEYTPVHECQINIVALL